jgi:hypothetical protein
MRSGNDYIVVLILAECTDSVRFPNPNTNPAGRCEVTERSVIKIFLLYIAHIIIQCESVLVLLLPRLSNLHIPPFLNL